MKRDKFSTMIRGTDSFYHYHLFCLDTMFSTRPVCHGPAETTDGDSSASVIHLYINMREPIMTGTSVPDSGFNYYTSTDLITWEFRGSSVPPKTITEGVFLGTGSQILSQQVLSHLLIP